LTQQGPDLVLPGSGPRSRRRFPVTIHCYDGWGGGAVDRCDLVLVLHASGPVVLDAASLRRLLSLVEPD
jgi:hypothetical protein